MKLRSILLFLSLLVLSCNEKELNRTKTDLTLEQFKVQLLQFSSDGNLITNVDTLTNEGKLSVNYEDGSSLKTPITFVKGLLVNTIAWSTQFTFFDNTTVSAHSIGVLQFSDSAVTINPYGTAPLTALAKVEMPVQGKFKIIVHGKQNGVDISHDFGVYGYSHEIPILGLYENYANQVEFQFMNSNNKLRASQIMSLKTDIIANKPALNLEIKANRLSPADQSIYLVSAGGPWGFDQHGEIRWYYSGDLFYYYGKLKNGNLLISSAQNTQLYYSPAFYEITMLGVVIKKYNVPNFQHHDLIELPSGNFLMASNSTPLNLSTTVSRDDYVVEIDRKSGDVVKEWNFSNILDASRLPLPDAAGVPDWLHMNSVSYTQSDNSIIVSSRSQSAVIKVDYASGNIKWILGDHNYWNPLLSAYLLTPVNSSGQAIDTTNFDFWPYGQHNAKQLLNGDILLYDDGDYRGFYSNPSVPAKSYSRLAQYSIDQSTMTVQLISTFDNSKAIFTRYTGSVERFANTTMIGYMDGRDTDGPKILEIDSNGVTVYEVNINKGSFYYRALKMQLYQGLD